MRRPQDIDEWNSIYDAFLGKRKRGPSVWLRCGGCRRGGWGGAGSSQGEGGRSAAPVTTYRGLRDGPRPDWDERCQMPAPGMSEAASPCVLALTLC